MELLTSLPITLSLSTAGLAIVLVDARKGLLPQSRRHALIAARTMQFIPVSALEGDHIVKPSVDMPWYGGPQLLDYLETVPLVDSRNFISLRFPVQYVIPRSSTVKSIPSFDVDHRLPGRRDRSEPRRHVGGSG